jgi:L-ascorbate metabolism protein UlaG (beta-lactamase superfamily)
MQIEDVSIQFLGHSGFLITTSKGFRIAIDPFKITPGLNKVDMILITHSHYDHCDLESITQLASEKTIIVTTMDSQSKITKLEKVDLQVIEIGDELDFGVCKIEAVPAYNINKEFHPKKEGWVGYVVKIGSVVVYHAGDTDNIPEMQKLTGYSKHDNNFVACLPVSGKYVMDPEEASDVAAMLKPDFAIPMHYGAGVVGTVEDAKRFVELCLKKNIKAEVLEKI